MRGGEPLLRTRGMIVSPSVIVSRVLAEKLVGLGFLQSISYIKPIPTHETLFAVGKSGTPMPLLTYFFLGLGWPWVGEFDGFIIIFICFPTLQNFVYRNRKHPDDRIT